MLKKITFVLVVVGALNWGLMGLFNFNLVTTIFKVPSSMWSLSNIIYDLIGLSGVYVIFKGGKM